jgi:predicted phosphoribosyltransferase
VSKDEIDAVIANETAELKRREKVYRGDKPFPSLQNKIVILIDDGIATGATMKAAMMAVRQHEPQQVVVAVPVADVSVAQEFSHLADEFVCPMIVDNLHAVGLWYSDFSQTEDDEVRQLLGSNK